MRQDREGVDEVDVIVREGQWRLEPVLREGREGQVLTAPVDCVAVEVRASHLTRQTRQAPGHAAAAAAEVEDAAFLLEARARVGQALAERLLGEPTALEEPVQVGRSGDA